ncbi:acinetodin/klebsidin/J25 family lasso peptide, partial [Escherichia marmotae]|nr:acinetodin/klebsidin/J25 family lasso peptide [Escherichia marmotae]
IFHLLKEDYINKKSASQLTKGGEVHVPEYFAGIGTPISFCG